MNFLLFKFLEYIMNNINYLDKFVKMIVDFVLGNVLFCFIRSYVISRFNDGFIIVF